MGDFIVTTERLLIRRIEDGDQDLICALSQDLSLVPNRPKEDKYMAIYRKVSWDEANRPNIYSGMIFLKDNGAFVGKICMQCADSNLPELGIDLMKAYQNHGYGPEAITAFCNWYSETFGLTKVKVRIRKDNTHSIHIFEKLGAEYEKATSLSSQEFLDILKEMLPNSDLSELSQKNVRDYLLRLPVPGSK